MKTPSQWASLLELAYLGCTICLFHQGYRPKSPLSHKHILTLKGVASGMRFEHLHSLGAGSIVPLIVHGIKG
ncbi:hypothetical protein BDV19DRAFT_368020 [Aspergillus venezuelensis]